MTTGGSSFAGEGGTEGAAGGTGGTTGGTGSGRGGSGGDAGSAAGGSSSGAGGGEPGGAPAGGEGGGGNCVDVCALHGEACCIPNVECVSSESNCLFEVLAATVGGTYPYDELEQRVLALPQDLLLSFTLDDVEWVAAEPSPAARIELHMSDELADRHAATLAAAFSNPFRVSCDGQRLFVGMFWMLEGAAYFDSPVLHVAVDEGGERLILRLGALMPSWQRAAVTVPVESRQRLDRAELRAALCLHGPLRELDALL